ncbi:MAG: DUF2339 domain-containing protein [Candidatus Omnitrophica bacterium]|jgi:uncharacterized membrane protein|nr:DUF2339 domain-containing protein [Candidatus Omnitrophota bacterium]
MFNGFLIWMACFAASVYVAKLKNRSCLTWFFLGFSLGPVALLIVSILPKAGSDNSNAQTINPGTSFNQIKDEFKAIQDDFNALSDRIRNLEVKISVLTLEEKKEVPSPKEIKPAITAIEKPAAVIIKKTDLEMDLGKFWLNKIGIIVFSLGVAFLLTYTVARFGFLFGALAKVLLGYAIAAGLLVIGLKLEKKDKFVNYGRVLLGGGWAIAYFTTYAMYHFEAAKVINSQVLDLLLLSVVALGIIAHSLRYKSEGLTAIALFVGYFTSVLADVGYFSLINASLLAVVALVVIYKMQWVRFIFVSIALTYLTHLVWVIKQISFSFVPAGNLNVENIYFHFDAGFLCVYLVLFTAAAHLIKNDKQAQVYRKLSAANFANFIFFFAMAYPKFYFFYPDYKFSAVLGMGLAYFVLAMFMELLKRKELFISDIIIAVSLITLSVPLKFAAYHSLVVWLIELPFLLYVGFIFKRGIYRYLAVGLSIVLFLQFVFYGPSGDLSLAGFKISWKEFLSLLGFISTAACFGLHRFFREKDGLSYFDQLAKRAYSGFSVVYLTAYVIELIKPMWLTFGLSVESVLIFAVGVLLLDKYIRWYALVVLAWAGLRFCFWNNYSNISEFQQLFIIYGPACCFFAEYILYRISNRNALEGQREILLPKLLFFASSSLLIFAIIVYVQQVWITLSIAIVSLMALIWAVKAEDRHIRVYSLLVLLLAAVRFIFIDKYYNLNPVFQWALISVKLACAWAAYFIYRNLNKKSLIDENEKPLISVLFYASAALMLVAIFQHVRSIWISLSWGLAGVVLFAIGFLIKEKIFRKGGFIVFGFTVGRIIFVDLAGLPIIYKIISFIVLGLLFLGVSFVYTKYTADKLNLKK